MNVRRRFAARFPATAACALAAALCALDAFGAGSESDAGAEPVPASPPATLRLPSTAANILATDGIPGFRAGDSGARSPAAADASRSAAEGADSSDPAAFLKELLEAGQDEPEFLHPDAAFRLEAGATGSDRAVVRWRIEPGYYLYAKRMEVHLPEGSPPGTAIAAVDLARGEVQEDPYFGRVEVFRHEAQAAVRLAHAGPAPPELVLDVVYQGCADEGLCYPPIGKSVAVRFDGTAPGEGAGGAPVATVADSTSPRSWTAAAVARPVAGDASLSETDRIARRLAAQGIAASVAAFFGFGLLLSFTPCIFPMIPILSSILVSGGGRSGGRGKGFALSFAYVSGSALAWAAIGGVAGLLGANVQIALQNPWALGAVSAMFVALALSMFGLFAFELPSAWVTRATAWTNRAGQGRGYAGAAVMGAISALIVGPCVAAPMAGAVLYIGQAGDAARGSLALFAMGFGMGMPLLALGAYSQRMLPRVGPWMDTVQRAAGVVLLAVAAYLLERVLPPAAAMVGWSVVAASACLVLLRAAWRRGRRGGGSGVRVGRYAPATGAVVAASYAALLVVGASTGAHDPLRPLAGLRTVAGSATVAQPLEFVAIKGLEGPRGLVAELARAQASGRFVMLDFYADWCVSCKEMEESTFRDPQVLAALGNVRLLRADVTANDAADQALMKRLGILGPPAILFFGPDREERRRYRTVGFKDADDFTRRVTGATGAA
ncbi:MAG: protein-disulfide reductase DsbD [Immundisolibacterales bacterium]|nr:protein-disulfide reductase DsbD [Immundisolibacterales bacterium]